ncbi:YbaB/EbfC family nucleoid-associated protein [Stackebrandtia soli]|uniref:YbaB/EbfC family nucleoid-associated protein n=1 Tax=Stackebrandtia soli TaxID=1892856 RepID=UPI0039ECA8FB
MTAVLSPPDRDERELVAMTGGVLTGREWIDDWKRRADKLRDDTLEMAEKMERLSVSSVNGDNDIRVTVNSQGVVTEIRFKESVRDKPADDIAQQVLSTMRAAQNKVIEGARLVMEQTVGTESETGRAIVSGLEQQLRPRES